MIYILINDASCTLFVNITQIVNFCTRSSFILGAKRSRTDDRALVEAGSAQSNEIPRTSNLFAPNMLLTGHDGEIFAARFSADGTCLASAGYDMKICEPIC